MDNLKELKTFLCARIPWTVDLLGILKNNQYEEIVYEEKHHYVGIKNLWNEWICYIESKEFVDYFWENMKERLNDCRIIVFAKKDIFKNLKIKDKSVTYEIEDFMCCTPDSNLKANYYLAKEEDIPILSSMQADYCMEEVGWKNYHIDSKMYQEIYTKKIGNTKIFLDSSHKYSKAEVTNIVGCYGKINAVYTTIDKRRQGLSSECIRGVLSWASSNNIKLCLNVRANNYSALTIYSRYGFYKNGFVLYMKKNNK